jgi:hypothetical protein
VAIHKDQQTMPTETKYTFLEVETAIMLFSAIDEYTIAGFTGLPADHPIKSRELSVRAFRERAGAAEARRASISLAAACEQVWRSLTEDETNHQAWDFEFIPDFVLNCVDWNDWNSARNMPTAKLVERYREGVALGKLSWRAIAAELASALDACAHQVSQMRGMFSDADETIQNALKDAEQARRAFNSAGGGEPASAETVGQDERAFSEGWGIFENSAGHLQIQADFESGVFVRDGIYYDAEAVAFVKARAAEGSDYHIAALARVDAARRPQDWIVQALDGFLASDGADITPAAKAALVAQMTLACVGIQGEADTEPFHQLLGERASS